MFIWQRRHWIRHLSWDASALLGPLAHARRRQGELLGKTAQLGLEFDRQVQSAALTEETLTTAAIEGEVYDRESVRSSVARRLGIPSAGLGTVDRRVEGIIDVLLDATARHSTPLTPERLWGWQAALFPTGYAGLRPLEVRKWRASSEPMRVVSGPIGREHVHFEAPPSRRLRAEIRAFLDWWSDPPPMDGLLRSGLAHLVFVTIHPFDDGNGRIARAIGDMALAQDEGTGIRVYSLSRRIAAERQDYYRVLECAQRGSGDITEWMVWFLGCLARAIEASLVDVDAVLARSRFWSRHGVAPMNERQAKVVRKLLEAGPQGFVGGMNTRKYVSLTGASRATAQRDLAELLERGVLRPLPGGGRTMSYELDWDPLAARG